jgi:hypothetical protein
MAVWLRLSKTDAGKLDAIIEWLTAEVERTGYLEHDAAAHSVWERFGHVFAGWTDVSDKHGRRQRLRRLHPDVVKEFKRRTSTTVVAEKADRAWRRRKSAA